MDIRDGRGLTLLGHELSPKHVQPRIVLLLLLSGSFAGVWAANWGAPVADRALRWLLVLGGGVLAGGLYWRLALFDASAFDDPDALELVRSRWAVVEAAAVWTLAFCGVAVLALGTPVAPEGIGPVALGVGCVLAPLVWAGVAWSDDGSKPTAALRSGLLALAIATLAAFAWVETRTTAVDWLVRVGHLGAFAVWVGGATWHNGIVLSAMENHPNARGTIKGQAKRFRKHLPVVIPVVFLTGGYQTLGLFGPAPSLLVESALGHLVVFKVLVLGVLTGIVVAHLRKAVGVNRPS